MPILVYFKKSWKKIDKVGEFREVYEQYTYKMAYWAINYIQNSEIM